MNTNCTQNHLGLNVTTDECHSTDQGFWLLVLCRHGLLRWGRLWAQFCEYSRPDALQSLITLCVYLVSAASCCRNGCSKVWANSSQDTIRAALRHTDVPPLFAAFALSQFFRAGGHVLGAVARIRQQLGRRSRTRQPGELCPSEQRRSDAHTDTELTMIMQTFYFTGYTMSGLLIALPHSVPHDAFLDYVALCGPSP